NLNDSSNYDQSFNAGRRKRALPRKNTNSSDAKEPLIEGNQPISPIPRFIANNNPTGSQNNIRRSLLRKNTNSSAENPERNTGMQPVSPVVNKSVTLNSTNPNNNNSQIRKAIVRRIGQQNTVLSTEG